MFSLAEKKEVLQNADLSPQKTHRNGVTPTLLEGSMVGTEAKGGTPPGSAGLMEQGRFDKGGGLMVRGSWGEEWGKEGRWRRRRSLCQSQGPQVAIVATVSHLLRLSIPMQNLLTVTGQYRLP